MVFLLTKEGRTPSFGQMVLPPFPFLMTFKKKRQRVYTRNIPCTRMGLGAVTSLSHGSIMAGHYGRSLHHLFIGEETAIHQGQRTCLSSNTERLRCFYSSLPGLKHCGRSLPRQLVLLDHSSPAQPSLRSPLSSSFICRPEACPLDLQS